MAGASGSGSERLPPPPSMARSVSTSHGQRDEHNKLRVGRHGGSKSLRHSTPRSSAVGSRRGSIPSMSDLEDKLARLKEEAKPDPVQPFRIKFVNHQDEAIMADIYPHEEFEDVIQRVTAKLHMPRKATYVLIYKDTDDEEIGVGCTDNMCEMFAIFEPGSRLQLRIVPFNIINDGALRSIAHIWDYGSTPNVFLSDADDDDGSSDGEASIANIDLQDMVSEAAKDKKQEMVQRIRLS
ncbi:hypothetical protein LPJ61_005135, partial [Coemansia biformis]